LGQQVAHPTSGRNFVAIHRHWHSAHSRFKDLSRRHRMRRLGFPEIQCRLDFLGAQLHPLATNLYQRSFEFRQGLELLEGKLLVAQRHLPLKIHQIFQ